MGIAVNGTKISTENNYLLSQSFREREYNLAPTTLSAGESFKADYVLVNTSSGQIVYAIYLNNYVLSPTFLTIYNFKEMVYSDVNLFNFEDLKIRYQYNSQNIVLEKPITELIGGLNIAFSIDPENQNRLLITLTFVNSSPFGDTQIKFIGLIGKLKYDNDYLIFYYAESSINDYARNVGSLVSPTAVAGTEITLANSVSLTNYGGGAFVDRTNNINLISGEEIPNLPFGTLTTRIFGKTFGHVLSIYAYLASASKSLDTKHMQMEQNYSNEVTINYD